MEPSRSLSEHFVGAKRVLAHRVGNDFRVGKDAAQCPKRTVTTLLCQGCQVPSASHHSCRTQLSNCGDRGQTTSAARASSCSPKGGSRTTDDAEVERVLRRGTFVPHRSKGVHSLSCTGWRTATSETVRHDWQGSDEVRVNKSATGGGCTLNPSTPMHPQTLCMQKPSR